MSARSVRKLMLPSFFLLNLWDESAVELVAFLCVPVFFLL